MEHFAYQMAGKCTDMRITALLIMLTWVVSPWKADADTGKTLFIRHMFCFEPMSILAYFSKISVNLRYDYAGKIPLDCQFLKY